MIYERLEKVLITSLNYPITMNKVGLKWLKRSSTAWIPTRREALRRSLATTRSALSVGRGATNMGVNSHTAQGRRPFSSSSSSSSSAAAETEADRIEREQMHYDCVIVGAGPAGLSAAIKLKQQAASTGVPISVCVIDKGSEAGAHILSGNVFEPRALDELFPNLREMPDLPVMTPAGEDSFLVLPSEKSSISLPHMLLPSQLANHGNYIISLSQLVRWLAKQAEELGVEIYTGFAASEVLYSSDKKSVRGVATKDVGIAKDGTKKDTFTPGIELIARHTLFAEGCRGSCSEEIMSTFNLREGVDVQTYGLGIKEVWEVTPETFQKGLIQHTVGWPLQSSPMSDVFGGTFLYHQEPNLVLLGMVVGLDYKNPYLNPYREFQRWKHHPAVEKHIKGGTCVAYGARVLNEGGYHAIPKLTFQGGSLIGCSAGFLNSVKIKGTHTAMKSGMLAAEAVYPLLTKDGEAATVATTGACDPNEAPIIASKYDDTLRKSWVGEELKVVRNSHAAFHGGVLAGMVHTALSCFITKGKEPWTLRNVIR